MPILLCFALLLAFTGPSFSEEQGPLRVKQGEILSFPFKSDASMIAFRGIFLNESIPLIEQSKGQYVALIGIDMACPVGLASFEIIGNGEKVGFHQKYPIEVIPADFGIQKLTLPKGMVDLDPPTLARVEDEKKRIKVIFQESLPKKMWEDNFIVPVEGRRLGTFGFKRIMNGQIRNQHSGEDIGAPLGTPVWATNHGRIVLVGDFYFNGQSVIIDHGFGLFTMYFHLLEITVKEGEGVQRGTQIGSVGQSGRATGPHLHWGARLNGARINPYSLISLTR